MKISVNAVRYINEHYKSAGEPAPEGVPALVQKIGAQLAAVEETVDFGARFEGVVVAKVMECVDHPDSDHLHVCKIDDGGTVKHVERDQNGLVQVVCGAPNVRAGLAVAWLPPGATVPESFEKEPMVLDARTIRGQKSNGMLVSSRELSLGDSHDGILEITEDIAPGTSFAKAFHLDGDVLIDMENKMFTHRPDCFGWLGVAREIEGIYHRPYKSPEWYVTDPEFPTVETDELPFTIDNHIPELVPRFAAIAMRGITIGPSPVWLQADLARAGIKSISNIVDYSNFYMVLTGQPIHIYDYDKLLALNSGKANLTVRHPKKGETIALLNGKTITPRAGAMMVAAGDTLVCVGGAMGGMTAEVDEHTRNIIIEVAAWDMFEMRRTSMEHGIFTDAVTRFTKGQSPLQNLAVLWKITDQIRRFADGKVASKLADDNHVPKEALKRQSLHAPVTVERAFINARLGWDLSTKDMATLLENVEFGVAHTLTELTVTAPFWRTDIETAEDVVEEIGRLRGYDHLPLELPRRSTMPAVQEPIIGLKQTVRQVMAEAGANEVLNYSFVHGNVFDKVGQDKVHAFQISNALSPELQYYRLSLTPSLLANIHPNIKAGYSEFALFEIGKVHIKGDADCDGLPREYQCLAFSYAAKQAGEGAPYYQACAYLEFLLNNLQVPFEIVPATGELPFEIGRQIFAPFEPKRSGFVLVNGEFGGFVGEYNAKAGKHLKLPAAAAGFEIDLDRVLKHQKLRTYKPLLRFPATEQDLCFKVKSSLTFGEVMRAMQKGIDALVAKDVQLRIVTQPLDIYQRPEDAAHKQITFRLKLQHADHTLTSGEIHAMVTSIVAVTKQHITAEQV